VSRASKTAAPLLCVKLAAMPHRVPAARTLREETPSNKTATAAHIEVEGTLRSREQTVELKGSSKKKPETKNVRSWFVRAESIRKLDRAERSSEDAEDVPF
jgi:hypothetical protein